MSVGLSARLGGVRGRGAGHGISEDSRAIRLVVALLVEVSVVAVVAQGAANALTGAAAIALVPVGYAYAYVRRARPSTATKVALAAGLLVALAAFLRAVDGARSFDDARVPLASLFLWVQVLHAFDVPRRRDLGFSVVSSVILIGEAGALSFGTGFLVFLLPWLALAGTYAFLTLTPPAERTSRVIAVRRLAALPARRGRGTAALTRTVSVWVLVAALAVGVVFMVLPRLPGATVALPPFRADDATAIDGFAGQVVNPGLEVGDDGVADFSDLAYPGFSSSVDLRSRGRLSEQIVLRIRSPQAALWRGLAYDTFDGTRWMASDDQTISLGRAFDPSFGIAPPIEGSGMLPTQHVLATVYVQADLPNVVFGAYRPVQVYFPTSQLVEDTYGGIHAPILLERGLVYSVVSEIPIASPEVLRATEGAPADAHLETLLERYRQLPADLPERVIALAERITAGETSRVDAVAAVEAWLRANTRYNLDIPADPPGVDAVDEFLFERREGFCEHIASAMTILLRSVGVPARLVTGFGPGVRNPFTGYWDVRASDAHAWVEVYYPGAGWIPYDPTFGVPPADPGVSGAFIAPEVIKAIGRLIAGAVPEPIKRLAISIGHGLVAAARAWPLTLFVGVGLAGVIVLRRRRRIRRTLGPPPTGAAKAFAELERAMAARGRPRSPHETPGEYLSSLTSILPQPGRADAELVVERFERERFAAEALDDGAIRESLEAAERLSRSDR